MKVYLSIVKVDCDEPQNYIEFPDQFLNSHILKLARNVLKIVYVLVKRNFSLYHNKRFSKINYNTYIIRTESGAHLLVHQ